VSDLIDGIELEDYRTIE